MTDGQNRPKTNSQPPGYVFGIVWPVLYFILGYTWMITRRNKTMNILHLLLVVLLNTWVYYAGCNNNYKVGGWLFVPIIAMALAIMVKLGKYGNNLPLLFAPFVAWLLFAHQLNVHIVEKR